MDTIEKMRTLPDIDPAVAQETGNDILLSAAARNRVKVVAGEGRRSEVRAWTRSGNVD